MGLGPQHQPRKGWIYAYGKFQSPTLHPPPTAVMSTVLFRKNPVLRVTVMPPPSAFSKGSDHACAPQVHRVGAVRSWGGTKCIAPTMQMRRPRLSRSVGQPGPHRPSKTRLVGELATGGIIRALSCGCPLCPLPTRGDHHQPSCFPTSCLPRGQSCLPPFPFCLSITCESPDTSKSHTKSALGFTQHPRAKSDTTLVPELVSVTAPGPCNGTYSPTTPYPAIPALVSPHCIPRHTMTLVPHAFTSAIPSAWSALPCISAVYTSPQAGTRA